MVEIIQNKDNCEEIEFTARDGDEDLGRISGQLDGDVFVISKLECDEFFIDGLVRAILNLMDLHGIGKARFDLPDNMLNSLRKLGFFLQKPEIDNIAAFFDAGCKHSS